MKSKFDDLELRIEKTSWTDLYLNGIPFRTEEFVIALQNMKTGKLYSYKYPFLTYSDAVDRFEEITNNSNIGDNWILGFPVCYTYPKTTNNISFH